MTKELKYSIFIISATLLFRIITVNPLEELLHESFDRKFLSELLAGYSIRLLLSAILIYIIIKKGFLRFNGLSPFTISNLFLPFISVVVILILAYSSYEYYFMTEPKMLLLFTYDQALVGIFEELLFRGIVFPLLILHFAEKRRPVLKAAFLSSILFGLIHSLLLIWQPGNLFGVTITVIFATGIGFFMAILFLKTRNILVPIFIHFLVDFTNGASALKEEIQIPEIPTTETMIITLAAISLLSLSLIGAGLFLYKRVEKEEWLKKVSPIRIN